jgi:hypothetical protein
MQHNIMHNANITENIISLPNLRSTIHKLQPKDLEYLILDSATSTFGNNGPNEDSIGDHSGTPPLIYAHVKHTKNYLTSAKQPSQ